MSKEEQDKWEKRYGGDDYERHHKPSDLLTKWIERLPRGKALDLACGTGRNALLLAEKGYDVDALDISPRAIKIAAAAARERGLRINWIIADLDNYRIDGPYDVIVISFFLVNKKIVPEIIASLKNGGVLLAENHMLSPAASAESSQHRFHLRPGELRQLFPGLKVLHYEERPGGQRDHQGEQGSYLASLVAQKE